MSFRSRLATQYLEAGGVISHPTDTIQGLACLPRFESSIERIIQLKRRSTSKGLILLASDVRYFADYVAAPLQLIQITIDQEPTTYLLKASQYASPLLTGGFDTVAIRLTDNPLVSELCQKTRSALVSTSANTSGKNTAINALNLAVFFKQELDFIITPRNYNSQPSRIINLQTGERLR